MITSDIQQFVYPKASPVGISFHVWQQRESWIIQLHYRHWHGLGECAPLKAITGDSSEELLRQAPMLQHLPLDPIYDDLEQLHTYLRHTITCPSLIAGIDMAYHDLIGQIQKVPVYSFYTKYPQTAQNSITVFLHESIEDTKKEAMRIIQNFPDVPIIKIKLKGNETDIARVQIIRDATPNQNCYILDANQGFSDPHIAVDILRHIASILPKILLVEEPCAKGHLEDMRYVRENVASSMMVFADESAATLEDVQNIITAKCADGINIKLQKAGGIWPARKIAQLAEKNSLKIMVGAMIEGTVGLTASSHFAATCNGLVLTDLDTDFDIPNLFQGGARYKNGCRFPSNENGLGIAFDDNMVAYALQKEELQVIVPEIRGGFF